MTLEILRKTESEVTFRANTIKLTSRYVGIYIPVGLYDVIKPNMRAEVTIRLMKKKEEKKHGKKL